MSNSPEPPAPVGTDRDDGRSTDDVPESKGIPGVGATGTTNIVIFVLGAVAGLMVARALGPGGRGAVAAATIGPTFAAALGTIGVEEATVFLVARASTEAERARVVWSSLALAVALGSIASLVSLGLQLILFRRPAGAVGVGLMAAFAMLPLAFSVTQSLLGTMRGELRFFQWNLARASIPLVYFLATVTLSATGRLSATSAVAALGTANLLLVTWLVCQLSRYGPPCPGMATARQLLSYGWRNHLITIQSITNQRLDQLVIAAALPLGAVGHYSIAVTYASAALTLGTAPGMQLFAHVSRSGFLHPQTFARMVRRTSVAMAVVGAGSAVSAPVLIPALFGPDYSGAIAPAIILLAGSLPLAATMLYGAAWKALGEPLKAARAEAVGMALTIVALPPLVWAYGIVGAASVSTLAYSLVALLLFRSKPVERFRTAR